jgi:hypothetical protein
MRAHFNACTFTLYLYVQKRSQDSKPTQHPTQMATKARSSVQVSVQRSDKSQLQLVTQLLRDIRQVDTAIHAQDNDGDAAVLGANEGLLTHLAKFSSILENSGYTLESGALLEVYGLGTTPVDFGGLGLNPQDQSISEQDSAEIIFLISAHLEALNSADRAGVRLQPLLYRPPGRRGMTLSEKIFAAHDIERNGQVKPGDIIRVDVDWIMASELSWRVSKMNYSLLKRKK